MKNPIVATAYYTLGVRVWDAEQPEPLCGDTFASAFMNSEAEKIWKEFEGFRMPNISNATRHAIIDAHLRKALDSGADEQVVVIGAGFDTRAFRMPSGRWVEIDEPAIIEHKEAALPSGDAPNPLTRVPIEFASESLLDKLAPFASNERTHVVIEGVFMYLSDAQQAELIAALERLFPRHIVYCDLMRKSFFERYSRALHEKIVGMGAGFRDLSEKPEKVFTDAGYTSLSFTSIALEAARSGRFDAPPFMVRWFLRTLRKGYGIWRFGSS